MAQTVQDPNDILSGVLGMQEYIKGEGASMSDSERLSVLTERFENLKEKNPPLFQKASKLMSEHDMTILCTMLKQLHNIKMRDLSEHDASVHVGQMLFDRYVKPVVGDNPPSS